MSSPAQFWKYAIMNLMIGKIKFLKNISLLIALVVVVYLVGNYKGLVQGTVMQALNIPGSSVQGMSTQKGQEISQKIGGDVITQLDIMQGQVLNLKVSDAVNLISRLQKIPKDVQSVQAFTKEQISEFMQSKK